MGILSNSSSAMMRTGFDKLLQSEAVLSVLEKKIGRYASIDTLRCAADGGLEAVIRIRGFSEDVQVVFSRAEIADDGSWIMPLQISANRDGVDALLKDMIQGKSFVLPEKIRPFAGMLKKLFQA